jgi:hypothetical protein
MSYLCPVCMLLTMYIRVCVCVSVWVWQTKFVSAVTRLEQAEAKLSKKRWMDAEACLQDMSLRPTINTGIMGPCPAPFHRIQYLHGLGANPRVCVCMCVHVF